MKIAIPTDDGIHVSAHLGQARYMLVVTLTDGQIGERQLREVGDAHQQPIQLHDGEHHHHHHARFERVEDCDMLVGGGMGQPAHQRLTDMGLQVITTDLKLVEDILQAALQGTLSHNPRRIHKAHH